METATPKEVGLRVDCDACGEPVMGEIPMYHQIKIRLVGLNKQKFDEQQGLTTFFGGGPQASVLAGVMGTGQDCLNVGDETLIQICQKCYCESRLPMAVIAETATEAAEKVES